MEGFLTQPRISGQTDGQIDQAEVIKVHPNRHSERNFEFVPVKSDQPLSEIGQPNDRDLLGSNFEAWDTARQLLTVQESQKDQQPITQVTKQSVPPTPTETTLENSIVKPREELKVKYGYEDRHRIQFAPTLETLLSKAALPMASVFVQTEALQAIVDTLKTDLIEMYAGKSHIENRILDDLSTLRYGYAFSQYIKALFVALLRENEHTTHLQAIRAFLSAQAESPHQILQHPNPQAITEIVKFSRGSQLAVR